MPFEERDFTPNRKTPCPCGSMSIEIDHYVTDMQGHKEEVYSERCGRCRNLLYGFSRPAVTMVN